MSWKDLVNRAAETVVRTFPTTVSYSPRSGAPRTIKGVFDAAFIEIAILDGAEVQSVYPRLFVTATDFPSAPPGKGDRATIDGTQYRVAECRPDGEAGYLLVLNTL